MSNVGKYAFIAGLVVAVIAAFVDVKIIPWVVGGLGILVGFLNVTAEETKPFLLAGTALVVALSAIHVQFFNPEWLNKIVFFERVFVAHVLLVVGLLQVFKTAGS